MSYRAPVQDIRFALEEIAAMDGLKATGAFPELSGDLTAQVLGEAARLANDVLAPLNWPGDRQGCTLKDGQVTTPIALACDAGDPAQLRAYLDWASTRTSGAAIEAAARAFCQSIWPCKPLEAEPPTPSERSSRGLG